jgi:hypothetical protein
VSKVQNHKHVFSVLELFTKMHAILDATPT